ncbi:bifunctional phosphopantothenoylcysteine decarboxylase/phosphopantothenate--cysteine ligase CoaBC [Bacillus sp. FJAT-44742]|uniref:bifunctional phosphopantothenoylcysteine decarboxylase/phosphopantothenate--cysteine ligase CoaBC n=1 Tax=Bacillus sp. FJAT-44742 TaxID=2014005 RepID=UPI000C23551E|nr:bifunctional phosphopantothenoylcysteine decarboxylase/phosphopantothenate--cysteine ligase CoaBC [Bacillus sp. FJAT-44742]
MIKGKNIVLAVTGGVAAFKAAALASKLSQAGADVRVMMTEGAKEFIKPLTFQALTRHRVYDDTFAEEEPEKVAHIDIADWADIFLIAPATANVIGKIANGIADDMVTTSALATKAKVFIAPAMNVNMYEHSAVQRNMERLHNDGYTFIEPGEGYLACGWIGKGRMAEPEGIVSFLEESGSQKGNEKILQGKHVLITAGPTHESIDPVRVFTNHSTGKMGYALAEEAVEMGAEVTLISGPVQLKTPRGASRIDVTTAEEMYDAVMEHFDKADVVVKTAAVADYTPVETSNQKVKKQPGNLVIEMKRTKDILAELGKQKTNQFLVGFAAESEHVEDYGRMKLENKNLDMVVANNITSDNAGFGHDTNIVSLISKHEDQIKRLPLLSKREVASEILQTAVRFMGGGRQ